MTDYTTNALNQAAWLVYINGLEVPVMGVNTNWGVWAMPTATIQLVPHPLLQRIGHEDRLQVVVFYLDEFWFADNPQFCLLGEFEVVGWSYNNSPRGRAIQLECVSHDQILEQLHFYYLSSVNDIAEAQVGNVATMGDQQATKILYPLSLFREGLTTPIPLPKADGSTDEESSLIKRPIDFVANIFRSLLSPVEIQENPTPKTVSVTSTPGTIPMAGANAPSKNFFARWLKMTQYHKRWCALPKFEDKLDGSCFPLLKAVQDTQTLDAVTKELGQSVGEAGSAWDLLQYVFGAMYMELAMIPCPPTAVIDKTTGIIQNGATYPTLAQFKGIMSRFVKPQCFFSLPPTCNVIFPSMTDSFTFRETYITQPTRLYLSEDFISDYLSSSKDAALTSITKSLLKTGYPTPIRKRLADLSTVNDVETNDKSCLVFPEEFFKGPVAARLNGPPWMYMLDRNANKKKVEETEYEVQAASEDPENDSAQANTIFQAYAEYEYYRSRYAERQGGVTMAWNPYIVPGFPAAVFDQLTAGFHSVAYVNSISHTMQASGAMSTSVALSFIRSMPEFMGIIGDSNSFSTELDIAPVEMLPAVRDNLQNLVNAQSIYESLFYHGQKLTRPSVFNWKTMLQLESAYGVTHQLDYTDLKKKGLEDLTSLQLVPSDGFLPLFKSYTAAMQYVSRPVCTLTEYVESYHGKTIKYLTENQIVKGEYTSFYSVTRDKNQTRGAVFWGRIYKLIQGPGTDPGVTVSNIGPSPDYAAAPLGSLKIVDRTTGMPETRRDWDKILEEYRKIVRSEEGKIAPQR